MTECGEWNLHGKRTVTCVQSQEYQFDVEWIFKLDNIRPFYHSKHIKTYMILHYKVQPNSTHGPKKKKHQLSSWFMDVFWVFSICDIYLMMQILWTERKSNTFQKLDNILLAPFPFPTCAFALLNHLRGRFAPCQNQINIIYKYQCPSQLNEEYWKFGIFSMFLGWGKTGGGGKKREKKGRKKGFYK